MAAVVTALPYFIGTLGAVCLALTVGFCFGVAYGARLQAAQAVPAAEPHPAMEPKLWPAGKIAEAMADQSGRPPIDFIRPYGSAVPKIPGLED